MATTSQYLTELQNQKNNLVDNLNSKGVSASTDEKFNTLIPKVLEISGGGDESPDYYDIECIAGKDLKAGALVKPTLSFTNTSLLPAEYSNFELASQDLKYCLASASSTSTYSRFLKLNEETLVYEDTGFQYAFQSYMNQCFYFNSKLYIRSSGSSGYGNSIYIFNIDNDTISYSSRFYISSNYDISRIFELNGRGYFFYQRSSSGYYDLYDLETQTKLVTATSTSSSSYYVYKKIDGSFEVLETAPTEYLYKISIELFTKYYNGISEGDYIIQNNSRLFEKICNFIWENGNLFYNSLNYYLGYYSSSAPVSGNILAIDDENYFVSTSSGLNKVECSVTVSNSSNITTGTSVFNPLIVQNDALSGEKVICRIYKAKVEGA